MSRAHSTTSHSPTRNSSHRLDFASGGVKPHTRTITVCTIRCTQLWCASHIIQVRPFSEPDQFSPPPIENAQPHRGHGRGPLTVQSEDVLADPVRGGGPEICEKRKNNHKSSKYVQPLQRLVRIRVRASEQRLMERASLPQVRV